MNEDDPTRKTYVYRVDVPVSARWISLVVAPFEILPDNNCGLLSHMCLPNNSSRLRNSVGFFHSTFRSDIFRTTPLVLISFEQLSPCCIFIMPLSRNSYYEEYLATSFPFGSYTQVFVAPEMAISSSTVGASMSIFSSKILYDEKVIDQVCSGER